jgi:hypothetical protein
MRGKQHNALQYREHNIPAHQARLIRRGACQNDERYVRCKIARGMQLLSAPTLDYGGNDENAATEVVISLATHGWNQELALVFRGA